MSLRAACGIGLILVLVSGCGSIPVASPESTMPVGAVGGSGDASTPPEADRLELLRTCPAKAPSWFEDEPLPEGLAGEVEQRRRYGLEGDLAYVEALYRRYDRAVAADPKAADGGEWVEPQVWGFLMTADEERQLWRILNQVDEAVPIAARYLRGLPPDQSGALRVDAVHGAVVVQVTREDEAVRQELQALVGDAARIVVEVIRYSKAELKAAEKAIQGLDGIRWVGLGSGNGDDRVEVSVIGDASEPRRRIEAVVDPCIVLVTSVGPVPSPVGPEGLRGVPVARPCDDKAEVVERGSGSAVEGAVQELLICADPAAEPRTVPAGSGPFDRLVVQLARQSMSTGGMPCLAIAYLVPPVYAITSGGVWQLELPRDACGQPYRELRDLLYT